jgi:hypothetical protein
MSILELPRNDNILRHFADDRRDAIKKELAKLLAAAFIREVFHPEWLANPVLVRKKNSNKWSMCVNYTDLNKHRPKDPFGLPRIDQDQAPTASRSLKVKTSATRGISTSSVDSTPSLSTTLGAQVCTTIPRPIRYKRPPGPGTSLRTTLL